MATLHKENYQMNRNVEESIEDIMKWILEKNSVSYHYNGLKLCTVCNNGDYPVLYEYTGNYFEGDPELLIVYYV